MLGSEEMNHIKHPRVGEKQVILRVFGRLFEALNQAVQD